LTRKEELLRSIDGHRRILNYALSWSLLSTWLYKEMLAAEVSMSTSAMTAAAMAVAMEMAAWSRRRCR
jgi:hypothetical protein